MIPIAIVAHTTRAAMAEDLAATVNAEHISYDDGTLGCDLNHRQAWKRHANTTSDWSVVLEDDAVPVAGFRDQLDQALAAAPAPIVSLYLGTGRPPHWQGPIKNTIRDLRRTNAAWITTTDLLHAVGVAIRTPLLPSLLQWLPDIPKPIDEAISEWAKGYGHTIAYTWPSLVDHADGPTLFTRHPDGKDRSRRRIAWHAAGRRAWNSHHIYMTPPN